MADFASAKHAEQTSFLAVKKSLSLMSVYCAVMAFSFNFMCVFQNVLLYYKSSGVDPHFGRHLGSGSSRQKITENLPEKVLGTLIKTIKKSIAQKLFCSFLIFALFDPSLFFSTENLVALTGD